jgi:hypothetical protein
MWGMNKRFFPRINVLAELGELFDATDAQDKDEAASAEKVPQVGRTVGSTVDRLWKLLGVLRLWNAGCEPRCTPLHHATMACTPNRQWANLFVRIRGRIPSTLYQE